MKSTSRAWNVRLGMCLPALLIAGLAAAQTYSHVRIVRLSFVEGTVTLQRPDVAEWSLAPVNTPIQEGFKVSTAEKSFAEIEFENTSTARLGELTLLEFTQLVLSPTGGKINQLTLHSGYATFNVMPEGDDVYEVKTADGTFTPYGKTTFRLDLDEGLARVSVLKGTVEVSSPYGTGTLARNTILEIRPGAEQAFQISQGITKDEWDEWVEQRESAGAALRNKPSPGVYSADATSLLYGWNDLWNYGNWNYLPGFGYGWAPVVPMGWVPYSSGQWCWYQGFGYTWIPYEPWGWVPYHYGYWNFVPGFGWSWFPGGFGAWSPAQVVWYQGPGWVGWAPRTGGSIGVGQSSCPSPQGCMSAISVKTFQDGGSVSPNKVKSVDVSQGRPVVAPEVPPTRSSMLPGTPFTPGSGRTAIAFDPASGRFVNSHAAAAKPVASGPATPPVAASVTEPTGGAEKPPASPSGRITAAGPERGAEFSGRPGPTHPAIGVGPAAAGLPEGRSLPTPASHPSNAASPSSGRHSMPTSSPHSDGGSSAHSASSSSHGSVEGGHSSGGGFSGGGASGGGGGHSGGGGGGHSDGGGGGHSGPHR